MRLHSVAPKKRELKQTKERACVIEFSLSKYHVIPNRREESQHQRFLVASLHRNDKMVVFFITTHAKRSGGNLQI